MIKKNIFLKNKNFWLMSFIVVLGLVLRLIFIDKPDGLWNDEYVSWAIASIPLGKKFIGAVFAQCHMPFYYFYLKFFIHFFGNSDLMLRLTSVLSGVLSIISMYFVGKELDGNQADLMLNSFQHRIGELPCDPETSSGRLGQLGILCASITALSSFLIYFSQEVRFYGILFLFSSLSLLFTLRLVKQRTAFNFILYIISNFLIIFTHSIGFVFVLFDLIFLSLLLLQADVKFKKTIIIVWSSLLLLTLFNLPPMFKIFTAHPLSQWWGSFTLSRIGFLITDYFSPILTNIVNAPDNFFYNFNLKFIIFALIPSLIAIVGVVKALMSKKYELFGLFYLSLAFILSLVIASISGKLVFITKYSIEIYPILIALMAYGLLEFKKGWRLTLIFLFCFLNLFYVLADSNSAPKMHRSEGHKIVAGLIQNAGLNKGDFIVLNYYPKSRFEKYFDFSTYNVLSIDKGNFGQYLGVQDKADLKDKDEKYFDRKFKLEVLDKLKPNQRVAVVVLKDVALYSPTKMYALLKDEKVFKKTPYLFLVFSQVRNDILNNCLKYLQIRRFEEKGSWSVITFTKK